MQAIVGVFLNPQVIVNGTDLSDHVFSVTVNMGKADVDVTAAGAYGKSRRPGLADESFELKFRDDYAASSVDAILAPLYINGTAASVEARPVKAARSSTNPAYSANACYLLEFNGIQGDIGNSLDKAVIFQVDGQTNGVQRLTA